MNNIVLYLLKLIAYYLLLFSYYKTTEGEKKTSLGTALSPEFTKIVRACMISGTVVYVTREVKEMVAMQGISLL